MLRQGADSLVEGVPLRGFRSGSSPSVGTPTDTRSRSVLSRPKSARANDFFVVQESPRAMNIESVTHQVLERLDALISKGEAVLATHSPNPPNVIGFPTLASDEFSEWSTQSLTYLKNLFGESHTYTEAFASAVEREGYTGSVKTGLGVLRASKQDVEGGYMRDVRTLVSAEVFSSFLEMASTSLKRDIRIQLRCWPEPCSRMDCGGLPSEAK